MKVYLLNELIDNCVWETLYVFDNLEKAKKRLNNLKKKDTYLIFEIKEVKVK